MTSLVAIGDLATDLRSGFACGEQDEGGVVQFRMNNVGRDGAIDWAKLRRVPRSAVKRGLTLVSGDVLFNATNSPELVGKTALFTGFDEDVTFSNHFVRLRPKPDKADSAYVARWLQSQFEKGTFGGMCRQWVNQATVTKDQLSTLRLPLPPLDEQRRIAAILDKADALRRKRKRALDLLDGLTKSAFTAMFGNPTTNSFGWPTRDFGDLAINESNKRIPVKNSDRDRRAGPYSYYGASGIIDTIDDYIFDGRRLLIGEDGANLLSRSTPIAFFAEGKFWVNNHAHVLAENNQCNIDYLGSFINQIDLSPYITGSAQPKLNRANMDKIKVMTPPLSLQADFEKLLRRAEALANLQSNAKYISDLFFLSLQHRAFTGQF